MEEFRQRNYALSVVPHEGTWIEIGVAQESAAKMSSFPTRERGLK